MKFSEQWLREWVNPSKDAKALAEQLTMAGLEVDAILPVANNFTGVVVGEVLSVAPHPDADRLRVCQVNVNENAPLQIVCGASNVRVGLKAPVALINAKLSADFTIKKSKLRGVESNGMLCSSSELGLSEKSEGLLELPNDAPIGVDIRDYLKLNDDIFELKITPNRGDCLSIQGVAREVGVLNRKDINSIKIKTNNVTIKDQLPIIVTASPACPKYLGRIIRNINTQATSPVWLVERLRRSNIRSIHPVVDVANYVMLELGQPLHGFDLDKLEKNIEVRYAKAKEKILLLNDQEVELHPKTLVIADHKQAHAIAGVMGGKHSGVSATTKNIFLESAYFDPLTVAHAVQHYHFTSDAAQRFERGVDPELTQRAIERVTELLIEIVGGEVAPIQEMKQVEFLPKTNSILLRRNRISRILGMTISDKEVTEILNRLGMEMTATQEGWNIIAPSYRFDITKEIDVIEELARIYGYEKIPTNLPSGVLQIQTDKETQIPLARIRQVLADRGYHEIISYSFISEKIQKLVDPNHAPKILANPISQDLSVMRTNLWGGLLQTIIHNQNRQELRARLFEIGLCFVPTQHELQQLPRLAGVITYDRYAEQWGSTKKPIDFFDIKNDVETLLQLGKNSNVTFRAATHPALHPSQSAQIMQNNQAIGWLGALHPQIQEQLEITGPIYLFELDLSLLQQAKIPNFKALSKFPSVRRDLAFIFDDTVLAAEIQAKIKEISSKLLKNIQIFDIYQGKGIEPGKRSVALALVFQDPERTLTENEVNAQVDTIVQGLTKAYGAKLRD